MAKVDDGRIVSMGIGEEDKFGSGSGDAGRVRVQVEGSAPTKHDAHSHFTILPMARSEEFICWIRRMCAYALFGMSLMV